jgi:hypothetical protein
MGALGAQVDEKYELAAFESAEPDNGCIQRECLGRIWDYFVAALELTGNSSRRPWGVFSSVLTFVISS